MVAFTRAVSCIGWLKLLLLMALEANVDTMKGTTMEMRMRMEPDIKMKMRMKTKAKTKMDRKMYTKMKTIEVICNRSP